MSVANEGTLILVVEDVEETRDGIEKLLEADGYRRLAEHPTSLPFAPMWLGREKAGAPQRRR